MSPSERTLRAVLKLLDSPNVYNKTELQKKLNYTEGQMKTVWQTIKDAELELDKNPKTGKYTILPGSRHKAIQRLKSLSDEDKNYIKFALKRHPNPELAPYIFDKIERLYDFEQMGLRALRRTLLDLVDMLEQSMDQKRQIILLGYRSNSSGTDDRTVECHEIDMESGTIKVFDLKSHDTKHFKLNRIESVELTSSSWKHETKYVDKMVDVFRIAENKKTRIHLLLDNRAYNALKDSFPIAADACQKGTEVDRYHLEIKVNHKFMGVVPFILGNPGHVKVLNPPELIEKVKKQVNKILANKICS